ncbi:MAG: histidinol-phosphate transaminase, partial [Thiomonas sp.]
RADFSIAVDDYLQAGPNGGIIFPNPNAPTGMALPLSEVERLLTGNPDSVVVVDEAYVDFGAQTAAGLIHRYPQLLVIRTLSKAWALAGLRVGYALGHPDLIDALTRVKDSFNSYPLDRLAQAGATAALQDEDWLAQTSARIQASREALSEGLRARGFEVLPSKANFVFARHPAHEGARLAAQLREHRILVRQFARPQRIADFLRITIGTPQQCEALLYAYDAIAQEAASLS